jgi:hypothetical protein
MTTSAYLPSFVSFSPSDDFFWPEPKHGIWRGTGKPNVFGGVLHAIGTIAGAGDDSPVVTSTMFYNPASVDKPLTVTRQKVDGSRVAVVTLTQDARVISQSHVIWSDQPEPENVPMPEVEIPRFREENWNWGIDAGYPTIWDHLQGWFRRGQAMMWLEGHDTDTATSAVLADFGTINLVPLVGRFGSTQSLVTHWFTGEAFEKVYLTHTIEGRTRGHVITRLDQYTERGRPICHTRMTARLYKQGNEIDVDGTSR